MAGAGKITVAARLGDQTCSARLMLPALRLRYLIILVVLRSDISSLGGSIPNMLTWIDLNSESACHPSTESQSDLGPVVGPVARRCRQIVNERGVTRSIGA